MPLSHGRPPPSSCLSAPLLCPPFTLASLSWGVARGGGTSAFPFDQFALASKRSCGSASGVEVRAAVVSHGKGVGRVDAVLVWGLTPSLCFTFQGAECRCRAKSLPGVFGWLRHRRCRDYGLGLGLQGVGFRMQGLGVGFRV